MLRNTVKSHNAQISGAALAASDCIFLLCGKCTLLEYNCEWVIVALKILTVMPFQE